MSSPAVTTSPRIAVVDDDLSVRTALRRLLRGAKMEAEAYGSGREFLAGMQERVPDCLVIDVQMPEMTGLQLQRHLREIGTTIPVVMITGHDEEGAKEACVAAGASSYLRKPLDRAVLLEAIERAIASAAAATPAQRPTSPPH